MDGARPNGADQPIAIGRYMLGTVLASGGMAAVHLGRLVAEHGFARTVAVKRLHPHLARDPDFVAMFLDEARLASRIRHTNVVPVLDIVTLEHELFLVMEYVEGAGLNVLLRAARQTGVAPSPALVSRVVLDLLEGLHAAHEAKGDDGLPLAIVHRDVSPQNLLVGADGVARVLDFGVAKAMGRMYQTRSSQIKGKLAYMAPEQLFGRDVTRRVDVFAAAVVLWEALTNRRLFKADTEGELLQKVTQGTIESPATYVPDLPPALEAVVMRGLSRDPAMRFATAAEMAEALEHACAPAPRRLVAQWVRDTDGQQLGARAELVADFERVGSISRAAIPRGPFTPSDPIPIEVERTAVSSTATVGGVAQQSTPPPMPPPRTAKGIIVAFSALAALGLAFGGFALVRSASTNTAATAAAPPGAPGALVEPPPIVSAAPAPVPAPPQIAPASATSATASAAPPPPRPAATQPSSAGRGVAPTRPKATGAPAGAVPFYSRE